MAGRRRVGKWFVRIRRHCGPTGVVRDYLMGHRLTLDELERMSCQFDAARWVHPEDVDFGSGTTETTPNELLTDQWSAYLSLRMPQTGDVSVSQIVADIVALTEQFGSSYTIYNLDTYVGYLVAQSPDRKAILERLNEAREKAPQHLKQAWSDLIADCCNESLQRLWPKRAGVRA